MTATLGLLIAYADRARRRGRLDRTASQECERFLRGRPAPARYLVFATVLAANIGAGSTVGAASLGYRDGLRAWWWNGSAALGTLLLATGSARARGASRGTTGSSRWEICSSGVTAAPCGR
jgi:solute:Na+ symporter, SSS family